MDNRYGKTRNGSEIEQSLFRCPPQAGESVRRIVDIDDIREKYRDEVMRMWDIDITAESDENRPPAIEKIFGEIEEYSRAIKEKIIWGVYGNSGELLEIVKKPYDVERLQERDAKSLQDLYTEGLANEPAFFGSTLEIERVRSIVDVKKYIRDNYVVGIKQPCLDKNGKEKERLIAMASVKREKGEQAHIAHAGLLYVEPAQRIRGLAEKIAGHGMQAVVVGQEEDLKGIEQLQIVVTATNKFAIEYYKKIGFIQYDYRPHAAKRGEVYYDWVYMMLDVTAARRKVVEEYRKKILEGAPIAIKKSRKPKARKRSRH